MSEPIPRYLKRPTAIIMKSTFHTGETYYVKQDNTYQLSKRRGDLGRWNVYYKILV